MIPPISLPPLVFCFNELVFLCPFFWHCLFNFLLSYLIYPCFNQTNEIETFQVLPYLFIFRFWPCHISKSYLYVLTFCLSTVFSISLFLSLYASIKICCIFLLSFVSSIFVPCRPFSTYLDHFFSSCFLLYFCCCSPYFALPYCFFLREIVPNENVTSLLIYICSSILWCFCCCHCCAFVECPHFTLPLTLVENVRFFLNFRFKYLFYPSIPYRHIFTHTCSSQVGKSTLTKWGWTQKNKYIRRSLFGNKNSLNMDINFKYIIPSTAGADPYPRATMLFQRHRMKFIQSSVPISHNPIN